MLKTFAVLTLCAASVLAQSTAPSVPEIQSDSSLAALTLLAGVLIVVGYRKVRSARPSE